MEIAQNTSLNYQSPPKFHRRTGLTDYHAFELEAELRKGNLNLSVQKTPGLCPCCLSRYLILISEKSIHLWDQSYPQSSDVKDTPEVKLVSTIVISLNLVCLDLVTQRIQRMLQQSGSLFCGRRDDRPQFIRIDKSMGQLKLRRKSSCLVETATSDIRGPYKLILITRRVANNKTKLN